MNGFHPAGAAQLGALLSPKKALPKLCEPVALCNFRSSITLPCWVWVGRTPATWPAPFSWKLTRKSASRYRLVARASIMNIELAAGAPGFTVVVERQNAPLAPASRILPPYGKALLRLNVYFVSIQATSRPSP